jgi:DNA-directed RNA polymerase subunit RPC12/RpoP
MKNQDENLKEFPDRAINCPKCGSDDVDHATVGLPDAIQCLDCGYLFAHVEQVWPFPDSLRPKKLNDQLPQRYNHLNDEDAPI